MSTSDECKKPKTNEEAIKLDICPLLSIAAQKNLYCQREYCAWWNEKAGCCCIKDVSAKIESIRSHLDFIGDELEGIKERT